MSGETSLDAQALWCLGFDRGTLTPMLFKMSCDVLTFRDKQKRAAAEAVARSPFIHLERN
jgi:hypothetical protein